MNKTCVISGATSGIGKTVAEQMAGMGWNVAAIGRSKERGEELVDFIKTENPNAVIEYYQADLSDIQSVKNIAARIANRFPVIDVLINNAGAVFSSFELTADGIERSMATNHINYFALTLSLMDNLKRSADARVINVSSQQHTGIKMDFDSFTQNKGYFIFNAYRQSKLANILFTYSLARRLDGSNISTMVLHPGVAKTMIGGKAGHWLHRSVWRVLNSLRKKITTEESAQTYIYLATDPEAKKHHAHYFHAGEVRKSSDDSYDVELQENLWEWSEEVTGLVMKTG